MSNEEDTLDLNELTPEERQQVEELRSAWKDLANSMQAQPVLYDINEETGEKKLVWLGPWQKGPDAQAKADALSSAKAEEYERVGAKAFEDTLPLENAPKPGGVAVCDGGAERQEGRAEKGARQVG